MAERSPGVLQDLLVDTEAVVVSRFVGIGACMVIACQGTLVADMQAFDGMPPGKVLKRAEAVKYGVSLLHLVDKTIPREFRIG